MSQIVLIVDDDITSLKLAMSIIEKDYRVATAVSGEMTLKYLEKNRPDLILLDLNMPDMDGLEVMEVLKADPEYSKIPVIFLTATHSPQVEAQCLDVGALDFVSKPFIPQVLRSRVRRILELYNFRDQMDAMVEERSKEIRETYNELSVIQNRVIAGMADLMEERENSTGRHVGNVQEYVRLICDALRERGLYAAQVTDEFTGVMCNAAALHDIGKIKIKDAILQKEGALSEEEFGIMKNHTRYGADIIDELLADLLGEHDLRIAHDLVMYHHERWDGSGYPEGLAGNNIPLAGRIMAVADTFDTLCEDCYREGKDKSGEIVFTTMSEFAGTSLDPEITEAFLAQKDKLKAMKK